MSASANENLEAAVLQVVPELRPGTYHMVVGENKAAVTRFTRPMHRWRY